MTVQEKVYLGVSGIEIESDGRVVFVSTEYGPRILFYGFHGGQNVLYVDSDDAVKRNNWHIRGGHRFWVSPETELTYEEDNGPCEVFDNGFGVSFISLDKKTNLEKTLTIEEKGDRFIVTHTLINKGELLYHGGVWAVSCVPPEGTIFFPWGTQGEWKIKKIQYWQSWAGQTTKLRSTQYYEGEDLFIINPSGEMGKVGTASYEGFVGVTNFNYTFIKKFTHQIGSTYPDDNCSVEVYTCNYFCELETLSPVVTLLPGISLTHTEEWILSDRIIDPYEGMSARMLL